MKFKVLSKIEIDHSVFTFKMVQHFLKLHCTASNEIKVKDTTDQETGVSSLRSWRQHPVWFSESR